MLFCQMNNDSTEQLAIFIKKHKTNDYGIGKDIYRHFADKYWWDNLQLYMKSHIYKYK